MLALSFLLIVVLVLIYGMHFYKGINRSMPYAYFAFYQLWLLISSFYLDLSVFAPELDLVTHNNGSSTILAVSLIWFHVAYKLTDRLVTGVFAPKERSVILFTRNPRTNYSVIVLLAICFVLLLFLLMTLCELLFVYGYGYGNGDRVLIRDNSNLLSKFVLPYAEIMAFTFSSLFCFSKYKKISLIGFFTLLVVFYFAGHKFSMFFSIICVTAIPLLFFYYNTHKKIIIISFLSFFVISILIVISKYISIRVGLGNALTFFLERALAGQAGLWWGGIEKYFVHGRYNVEFFFDDLESRSLVRMMVDVLGVERVRVLLERGYLLTMGAPVVFVSYAGLYGLFFFYTIIPIVFCCMSRLLYLLLRRSYFFMAIVFFSVLWPFVNYNLIGDPMNLFRLGMLAKVFILFFCVVILWSSRRVKKSEAG